MNTDKSMKTTYISNSFSETKKIGKQIAGDLIDYYRKNGRVVIGLEGELGAGKTALVKGMAKQLKISENITSPTFLLVREYTDSEIPLYHFDFYRLKSENDLDSFGFFDYLNQSGFFVIEWAQMFETALPEDTIFIKIDIQDNGSRKIEIKERNAGDSPARYK